MGAIPTGGHTLGVQDWLLRREGDPAVEREKHEVHPQVVQDYLKAEVAKGRVWDMGMVAEAKARHIH